MKKFLKISAIVFVGFFLFLVILGWALEDHVTELAIDQVSQTIEAPMGIEDVHFSLVKHFPLASIRFDGLWIAAPQTGSMVNQPLDTLIKIGKLDAWIDAIDAFEDHIVVREISLSDGYANYTVDSTGATNFDFLLKSDTTTFSQEQDTVQAYEIGFAIETIGLKNVLCQYADNRIKAAATLRIEEINGELGIDSTKTLAALKGGGIFSELRYDETNLHRVESVDVAFDVFYHNDTIRANTFSAQTKGLNLEANGDFILGTHKYVDMDLKLSSESLAALLKYAPDTLLSTYDISQVSGDFELNTKLEGEISKDTLPSYEASLMLSDASLKYADYPLIYNLAIDLEAFNGSENNNETTEIKLNKLESDFDGSHIDLQASVSNLDKIRYDLKSNMDLDLSKVIKLIPDSTVSQLSGNLRAFVATSGVLSDSVDNDFIREVIDATELDITLTNASVKMDSVLEANNISARAKFKQCQFDLTDMEMYLPDYELRIFDNSISACVTGDIFDPKSLNVDISSFRLGMPDSSYVWGKASLDSLRHVSYDIETDLNLDLTFWKQFVPDTLFNDMSGRLLAKIKSYGEFNLDSVATQVKDIIIDQTIADLDFRTVTLDMKDTLINIQNLDGTVAVKDHLVSIDELKGTYTGVDFRIAKATVGNPFNTALRNQSGFLKVDGEYYLGAVDYKILGMFIAGKKSNKSSQQSSGATDEPSPPRQWNLDVRGEIDIESFRYDSATLLTGVKGTCQFTDTVLEVKGKLAADRVDYGDATLTNLTGFYNVKESEYIFDQFKFDVFEGDMMTSLKIRKLSEDQMLMKLKTGLNKLDMNLMVKELPFVFDNFIRPQELTGKLSSDTTYLQFTMEGKEVDMASFRMKSHVLFEEGGFYNYPPVTSALSDMPSTKNHPDTLLFNTIDTHMFIYQEAVNIPETKVVTNKLSAKMTGEQSFGEDYDYRVGINYKDVVVKNKKVKAEKEDRVNVDIDDVKLENLKWWKASGRKGKYKTIPITSDEFDKKQKIIGVRESWLDLKFKPKRFNFDTQVD